jgi:hypothetical protein
LRGKPTPSNGALGELGPDFDDRLFQSLVVSLLVNGRARSLAYVGCGAEDTAKYAARRFEHTGNRACHRRLELCAVASSAAFANEFELKPVPGAQIVIIAYELYLTGHNRPSPYDTYYMPMENFL